MVADVVCAISRASILPGAESNESAAEVGGNVPHSS